MGRCVIRNRITLLHSFILMTVTGSGLPPVVEKLLTALPYFNLLFHANFRALEAVDG